MTIEEQLSTLRRRLGSRFKVSFDMSGVYYSCSVDPDESFTSGFGCDECPARALEEAVSDMRESEG